jgi:hypothetical protein
VNNGTRLPSLQALIDPDDDRLLAELRLMAARRQIATFRSIADELERCLDGRSEDPLTRTDESGVHRLRVRDGE